MRRLGVLLTLALLGAGWRHDGTARYPSAAPPITWSPAAATWRTPLGAWGNASPVLVSGRLCTTSEPTTVLCVDAATGRMLWNATNDRIDTVPPSEAASVRARLAKLGEVEARASEAVRRMGVLRRDLRRTDAPPDTAAQLAAVSAELDQLQGEIESLRAWQTPPVLGMIGYGSSTPATDGTNLYVMTGNGVVSSFTAAGARRWSLWMGPVALPMRGYDYGSVTSPQLVDGVLVAGHSKLRGLDPATGKVLWEDAEPWNHYGTPGVMKVGGASVLLLPDGRVLRAKDGAVLARDLGNIYYLGPIVDGDVGLWIGGRGHRGSPTENRATAWRISSDGAGGVRTTRLWDREVPGAERVYTSPVVHGGKVWILTLDNVLTAVDLATGATRATLDLVPTLLAQGLTKEAVAYTNPTIAGSTLFLGWQPGLFLALAPEATPRMLGTSRFEGVARATPVFDGRTVYVRTAEELWRFDAR